MFTIEYVKNLQWCDAEHSMFECVVKYTEFNEELPSGISPLDKYQHIQEIWNKANDGVYGEITEYVPPPPWIPLEESLPTPATGEIPVTNTGV